MNMMIELDGISRIETGREEVTLAVALGATGQEVIGANHEPKSEQGRRRNGNPAPFCLFRCAIASSE